MGCRSKIKTLFSLSSILLNLSRLFSILQRGTSSKRDLIETGISLIEMKTRGGQKWYLEFLMSHFATKLQGKFPCLGRQTFQVLPNCLDGAPNLPSTAQLSWNGAPNLPSTAQLSWNGAPNFPSTANIRHNLSKLFFLAKIIRACFRYTLNWTPSLYICAGAAAEWPE